MPAAAPGTLRTRRIAAALALAALLLAAGCGKTAGIDRGGRVVGDTLTVYALVPSPGEGAARDLVDGQRLALREAGGRTGPFKVNLASLDETRGEREASELPGAVAASVRQAIADPQIIAAIADLGDETARTSIPLLNAAGILHVSPGATYPGFLREVEPGEPERWYPAGERTFFPLVPDAAAQARALAGALEGRVLVEQEESPGGRAFGAALRAALGDRRLVAGAARADAAVYAGTDPRDAAGVVDALLRENRSLTVHLPSALAGAPVARRARVAAVTARPEPSRAFSRAFREAFGRDATPAAAAGHAAMEAVLRALGRAGKRASNRQAVIEAFRADPPPAPELRLRSYRGGEPVSRPLR